MNDKEKAELNEQKKLVDCVRHINSSLEAFERLEDYQERVIPIIDGFDLTHSDTYLELTGNLRRELFYIKFFSEHAASKLFEYRQLCNPDEDIYSVKEKKNKLNYETKLLRDWRKQSEEMKSTLDKSQNEIDRILRNKENNSDLYKSDDLKELKDSIDIAHQRQRKEQIDRAKQIVKIEFRILRLEWAVFLIFLLQISILIKITVN